MKHSNTDWVKNQSTAIDLLRFPLAIAVIFIHMNPETINLTEADFPLMSGRGVYNVVGIAMSHVVTRIAVPTFFLISGLLFFINFRQWSWDGYKSKMRSRMKTLVLPYILWNILAFGIIVALKIGGVLVKGKAWEGVLAYIQEHDWHIFIDSSVWGLSRVNILGWPSYSTGPFNLPLWFLRDLIVVSILSPVIYWVIKKTGFWAVLVLFMAYVTRIWILLPGFGITAFFYFTLGAYFAIKGKNVVLFARKFSMMTIPVSCLLMIVCIIYDGPLTVVGNNLMPFYVVTTVFVAFAVASYLVEKYGMKPNKVFVKSCFFVYAAHTVGSPMALSEFILHNIIPGASGIEDLICYILTPFCTAAVCVSVYYILSRYVPKIAVLFTGRK